MSKRETTQEYKNRLNLALSNIEQELKAEFGLSKASGKKVLKRTALVAGGGLLIYAAINILTKSKKKSQVSTRAYRNSAIGPRIKSIVLMLMLELAKRQLMDILKNKSNDHKSSEQDQSNRG